MAGYIGKIEPFDDSTETWSSYVERLEQYFAVNALENEKKVPALLALLGGKTYGLLRNLTLPDKPAAKSYDDIVKLLKDHLSPKLLIVAERFRFYKRYQIQQIGRNADIKAHFMLKENASPKFVKARPVPFSVKPQMERELIRLEKQGIISNVDTSEWASPIVPVMKSNGTIRICGDFKTTVKNMLNLDQYPLPRTDEIFATLAGGQKYTKLDIRNAYLHMEVDDESKPLMTINTHKGLYRYNRMLFGIELAPAI
ncbi:Uncharacterized protein K02A2.6 [Mytilus coruscus]|uniref:Uncharacterized protein K02A2.6 n=1 Tax=Mytilus coruscus TaxID=42192 RepID=A0A6J8ET53_MYTCO|nr:Uncharacterized protein K02A2.6 [Mytilus coruscus]